MDPMFDNPNYARDLMFSATLNRILNEMSLDDIEDRILFLNYDHVVIRVLQDVMLVIALPPESKDWGQAEFDKYMDGLAIVGQFMNDDLKTGT